MKTKVLILVALTFAAGSALAGGPQVAISIGTGGGWCPPVSYCPPVVYRQFPVWSGYSPVFWSSGGGSAGSFSGFSNVSPVMNYQAGEPVYRVPPPVLPAQPVTVYPMSPFGWRR